MDTSHFLLGWSWQFDRDVTYKGHANKCSFDWHGGEVILRPSSSKSTKKKVPQTTHALLAISGSELQEELLGQEFLLSLLAK